MSGSPESPGSTPPPHGPSAHSPSAGRPSPRSSVPGLLAPIDLDAPNPRRAISWRSCTLGLCGALAIAILTPHNDYYLKNTYIVGNHFPIGVVFLLLVFVLGVNPWLRRLRPGGELSPGELIVITAMLWVACSVPSSGLMRYWPTMLVGPFYYSRWSPYWADSLRFIPDWMVPTRDPDSPIVVDFYLGLEAGGLVPWLAWVRPFLLWGIFFVSMFVGVFCLAVLLRRQWVRSEKLAFPLAMIPLAMVEPPRPGHLINDLFRSRRLWFGAALVVFLMGLRGLHMYFPAVPEIPTSYDIRSAFTEFPWDGLPHYLLVGRVYFSIAAVAFFITLEIGFSLWFFIVLFGLVAVVYRWLGLGHPWSTFRDHQFGAWFALAAAMLWVSRRHLWEIVRSTFGRGSGEDRDEYLPYRVALVGLVASVVVCVVWMMAAGAGVGGAIVSVLVMHMLFVVIARIVAETGLLFIFAPWTGIDLMAVSPGVFSHQTFVANLMVHKVVAHDMRECLMPFAVNSLRLADGSARIAKRTLVGLLLATVIVAMVASAWSHGRLTYTHGGRNLDEYGMRGVPRFAFDHAAFYPTPASHRGAAGRLPSYLFGAAVLGALSALRLWWTHWPLHPIGYIMANMWTVRVVWFSLFLGWALKALILRYGGAAAYNRNRPLFIGLIVGEAIIGTLWMSLVWLLGPSGHVFRLLPG